MIQFSKFIKQCKRKLCILWCYQVYVCQQWVQIIIEDWQNIYILGQQYSNYLLLVDTTIDYIYYRCLTGWLFSGAQ